MIQLLERGRDPVIEATLEVLRASDADILVLGGIDWDHTHLGLHALQTRLNDYPYSLFPKPVSGIPSGYDLDGDGRLAEPEDALGYGKFTGDGGVAILSRLPLGEVTLHHHVLWQDWANLEGLVPEATWPHLPLASDSLFEVSIRGITLLAFTANTPVFDGPENRNGIRNAAQLRFLHDRVDSLETPLLIGRANADPVDGEGNHAEIKALLNHPRLQPLTPLSEGGALTADTANWSGAVGSLRVDYILPAREIEVVASGVLWPHPDHPFSETVNSSGANRLIWADLTLPQPSDTPPQYSCASKELPHGQSLNSDPSR